MPNNDDTKTCPWCGEEIKRRALICRYCHRDVTEVGEEEAKTFSASRTKSGKTTSDPVAPPEPDPTVARLSKFVPSPLLEKIIEGAEAIDEGEKRPIAILFSDLCGFTSLTREIGAEAMNDLLEEVFGAVRETVAGYDGVVEKFIGDAVMAVFGAPKSHGDDPERAVRAALDIRRVVQSIGERSGHALDTHAGIAYGEVVLKRAGQGGRLDFGPIGSAANLASRLQGLAAEGETLVDRRIHRQTRTSFEWEEREYSVKSIERPVRAYSVRAVRRRFPKVELGERIPMAPLVGRRSQLEMLKDAAAEAAEGTARVAVIRGQAGVGKSRLVYELSRELPPNAFGWVTLRCLSFGATIPFLPFGELLRSLFFPDCKDEEPRSLAALRKGIDVLYGRVLRRARTKPRRVEVERQRDLCLHASALLLSIDDEPNPLLDLTPQERRKTIFSSITDLCALLCDEKPTVFVFEDLHWADEDSLDLLDHLIVSLQGHRALLAILTRPDLNREFPLQEDFLRLPLRELGKTDSATLLSRILGLSKLPKALRRKILDKAEGNPFFVEEMVLSLEEQGILKRRGERYALVKPLEEIRVPDTVEGLILSRLDRLETRVKSVMQCAAVIGQEFRYRTLANIEEISERLHEDLRCLVEGEYVLHRTSIPELAYLFRHFLLREVAYRTLLDKRRRFFHARVAAALETTFQGRIEEHVELLAFHYERGGVADKAIHYLERAALKCQGLYAARAEMDCWERLLALLDKAPQGGLDRRPLALRAHLQLAELCRRLGKPDRGVRACQDARALSRTLDDGESEILAMRQQAEALRMTGQFDKGTRIVRNALKKARELGSEDLVASCQNLVGHFERIRGNYTKARVAFEEVLRYAEKTGSRKNRYQALNHLGILFMHDGETDQSNRCYGEALELARELGRRNEQTHIEVNMGLNRLRAGECDKARKHIAAALSQAEKIEFELGAQTARIALCDLYLKTGQHQRALTTAQKQLRRLEDSVFRDCEASVLCNCARASVAVGRLDSAKDHVDKALKIATEIEFYLAQIDGLAVRAELFLARGEHGKARDVAEEGLALAKQHREREFVAMLRTLKARAELGLGEHARARTSARAAIKAARTSAVPRDEGWALFALGQIQQTMERPREARSFFSDAAEIGKQVQDSALKSRAEKAREDLA